MSDDWLPEPPSREWVKRTGEWIDKMQKDLLDKKIDSYDDFFRCAAEVEFGNRLIKFAEESNKIEGVIDVSQHEIMARKLNSFLNLKKLTVKDVCDFNEWGELRDQDGMDVWIGGKMAPSGGSYVRVSLEALLSNISNHGKTSNISAYHCHMCFERSHPFMDGNGRTGRAVWLWQMVNHHNYDLRRGFLHEFYYQSLRS